MGCESRCGPRGLSHSDLMKGLPGHQVAGDLTGWASSCQGAYRCKESVSYMSFGTCANLVGQVCVRKVIAIGGFNWGQFQGTISRDLRRGNVGPLEQHSTNILSLLWALMRAILFCSVRAKVGGGGTERLGKDGALSFDWLYTRSLQGESL